MIVECMAEFAYAMRDQTMGHVAVAPDPLTQCLVGHDLTSGLGQSQ